MIPVFFYYVSQASAGQIPGLLLGSWPRYLVLPSHKIYFWLCDGLLHAPYRFMVFGLVFLHLANALGVAWLGSLLGLPRRASRLAGLLFLTLFIPFHAFLWPSAVQHLLSVSLLVAVLSLFLKVEQRIESGKGSRGLYLLGWGTALLASTQYSALIGLILIGCHILFCSPDRGTAEARWRRWFPVFVTCLVYPIASVIFMPARYAQGALAAHPLSAWLNAPWILPAAAGGLFLAGKGIRFIHGTPPQKRAVRIGLGLSAGLFLLWLVCRDSRQALLPYNALVPFSTILASFLDPFRAALSMDPVECYYYLPANLSPFVLGAALFLGGAFWRLFVSRDRKWGLLFIWYGLCLVYLLLHKHVASSMPFRTQSRYFVYLTPLFSIVIAGLAGRTADWLERKGWKPRRVEGGLWLALLLLAVPNLLAIRVALFRGRLVNSYLVYDDLRTARLVRDDLAGNGLLGSVQPKDLYIQNAVPLLFPKFQWDPPVDYTQIGQDFLRRFLGEELRDRRMRSARINENPAGLPAEKVYRLEGNRILDSGGRSIEPFGRTLDKALARLKRGEPGPAGALFERAVSERPFLLNYLLGPGMRLSDSTWITGGDDLRGYCEQIRGRNQRWGVRPVEKVQRTSELIDRELSEYLLCLFCLSYLEDQAGHPDRSRFWFSQIGFIEREPEALFGRLSRIPEIRASSSLQAFAEKARDPLFFQEPLVGKKEDYAFGRFLVRLVLHRDIRSKWDSRFSAVP